MVLLTKPLFNVAIYRYRFSPSLLSIFLVLLLLPCLIRLGFWQLQRAAEKQHLQNIYQARSQAAPIDLVATKKIPYDLQYYSAIVTGVFDNAHQFLLDNKIYQHRIGYEVLTPFILQSGTTAILVNRGWIPQEKSRNHLPVIKPVVGEVTIQGFISVPPAKSFRLGNQIVTNIVTWPQQLQYIDFKQVTMATHHSFLPFVLLLKSNQLYGFQRDWSPMNLKVSMHYGYAFQWFSLAVTLFLIFIIVNTRHDKN